MFPLAVVATPYTPFVACCYIAITYAWTLIAQWTIRLITSPSDQFWVVKSRPIPPATLTDPAFGNHFFLQTKTLRFHGVEKGDKSNPLMLMIHGYPEFWYSWRYQLQNFSSDYWCVAVDMRGYGDSDKPPNISNYTLDYLVDDIKQIVTALGRDNFTLVAQDWGGAVGWSFVTLHPEMIDSYVILNSVHPTVLRDALFHSHAQVNRSWYMAFYNMPCMPEARNTIDDMAWLVTTLKGNNPSPFLTDDDIEAWKYTYGKPRAFTWPLNYYRANILFEISKELESKGHTPNDPPGMALFGKQDNILDLLQKSSVEMMCNTRYVEVNASHFLQQDDPIRTNNEIWKFLADIKSKRPAQCP